MKSYNIIDIHPGFGAISGPGAPVPETLGRANLPRKWRLGVDRAPRLGHRPQQSARRNPVPAYSP